MKDFKLVVLAPGADGTDVGEAWSSFQWIRGATEWADVTVLNQRRRGRASLVEQLPNARVIEWDEPHWCGSHERISAMLKPGYPVFYRRARTWLKQALARDERIDCVQQVAPIAMRYPCPAVGLRVPFVLGPLAGSLNNPPAFARDLGRAPWYTRLRSVDRARLRWDPLLRRSFSEARLVLGVAPYVQEVLAGLSLQRFELEAETGIESLPMHRDAQPGSSTGELRLLYVGRLVPTKGLAYAIEALGRIGLKGWRLDVLGDGEERERLQRQVLELGLEQSVHFHGRVPRETVDEYYGRADAFVFPSLREPSGNVVFEALSHGLPVLACDRGGPGHVVTEELGWKLPVEQPEQLVASLGDVLGCLIENPSLLEAKAKAARDFARTQALWPAKIQRMRTLLMEAFSHRDDRPKLAPRFSA